MLKNLQPPYEVVAYYFPQYHPDARNDAWHGHGWTEWDILQAARPRYPGHRQPIEPAWGYFNEADPQWAAREIDLAADHGITTFLYDWYWYDDQPFLHDALERGFLAAPNTSRLKFALMWANHTWLDLYTTPFNEPPAVLTSGRVSRESFERMTDYIIEHYFSRPNYLTIDGAPYFSLFELAAFVDGLGGLAGAERALQRFREKTRTAGFPDLHLNTMVQHRNNLPGEALLADPIQTPVQLGFSSVTSYNWHQVYTPTREEFPAVDYATVAAHNYAAWDELSERFPIPYYPGVTMGWDSSPRTDQQVEYAQGNYPWTSIYEGNTPGAFKEALLQMKAFLDRSQVKERLFTINAWNEWTEGSYLLPDTVHGTAYLEAIKEVFGA
jgi:hypothetical protein